MDPNNLRQIVFAVHNFSDAHAGGLPPVGDGEAIQTHPNLFTPAVHVPALFVQILPYIEARNQASGKKKRFHLVPLYISPGDPTGALAIVDDAPVSSYAANAQAFKGTPRVSTTFHDGMSNTIAFAEHYAYKCNGGSFYYSHSWPGSNGRASFADIGDIIPVTQGNPPVTMPSTMPKASVTTFQAAPRITECSGYVAQTPHSSGMLVALADGSVRQLAPNISPATYWAAVTPAGSEVFGSDWD